MGVYGGPDIVEDGLVLCLDAGNSRSYSGSGTAWNDLSGQSNNGTLTNGPTFSSTNGGTITLDGTNDYVAVTGSITATQATFLSWVYRNGSQISYSGIIFSRSTEPNVTGTNFRAANDIGYHWNGAVNTYDWVSGLIVPNLSWCMVAVSVSPTSATAYLCQSSGISTATNTVSHASSTINAIRIGHDPAPASSRYAKATLGPQMIYTRALSISEIEQNFNATRSRYGI